MSFRQAVNKTIQPILSVDQSQASRDERDFYGRNMYQRTITLNGTFTFGKVMLEIDALSLVNAGKLTPTMKDLRVYNSTRTQELAFWVKNPGSNQCKIYVVLTAAYTGSSGQIIIEYGNPNLPNKSSLASVYPTLALNSCTLFFSPVCSTDDYVQPNLSLLQNKLHYVYPPNSTSLATSTTVVSGQHRNQQIRTFAPTVATPNPFFYTLNTTITAGHHYAIFSYMARTSGGNDNFLISRPIFTNTNHSLFFGWGTNTAFRWGQYGNDLDATVAGYTSAQGEIWSAFTNGSGRYLRRSVDASALGVNVQVATSANSTTFATEQPIYIGKNPYWGTGHGQVGDVIIFSSSTALTLAQVQEVEGYLWHTYRHQITSQTLGAESLITGSTTPTFTGKNYSNLVMRVEKSPKTLTRSIYTDKVYTEIVNNCSQELVTGRDYETHTNSTAYKLSQRLGTVTAHLDMNTGRRCSITTTPTLFTTTYQRTKTPSGNLFSFENYTFTNPLGTTSIPVELTDLVEVTYFIENGNNINQATSQIRFINPTSGVTASVALNKNINPLLTSGIGSMLFKLSDFTVSNSAAITSGLGFTRFGANLVTSTSTATLAYMTVRLFKMSSNEGSSSILPYGSKLVSQFAVNGGSGYTTSNDSHGVIFEAGSLSDSISVYSENFLNRFAGKTFKDMGILDDLPLFYNPTVPYLAVQSVISLLCPVYYINSIDINYLYTHTYNPNFSSTSGYDISWNMGNNYTANLMFTIQPSDDILTTLTELLTATGYEIVSREDGRLDIVAINRPRPYWQGELLGSWTYVTTDFDIAKHEIIEYKDVTQEKSIINQIQMPLYFGRRVVRSNFIRFVNQNYLEVSANSTKDIYIEQDSWNIKDEAIYFTNYPYLEFANFGVDSSTTTTNNIGVEIRLIQLYNDKVLVRVANANSSARYLKDLSLWVWRIEKSVFNYQQPLEAYTGISTTFSRETQLTSFRTSATTTITDETTVKVADRFSYFDRGQLSGNHVLFPLWIYDLLELNKSYRNTYTLTTTYIPGMRRGRFVSFFDKFGRRLYGVVKEFESNYNDKGLYMNIVIFEVQGVTAP